MALILNGSDTSAGNDAGLGYTSAEGIIITGQGTTSDVTIKNDADATVLSIPTGSGNVGIGTTAASTYANSMGNTLVVGTGNNFAVIQGRTDGASGSTNGVSYGGSYQTNPINGARMLVGAAGSAGQRGLITFNTKNTDDDTNQPTEKMRIAADGNVGIGETSPAAQLHVKNSGGNSVSIVGQYGTGTRAEISAFANQVELRAYNGTNDVMTFKTGSTERMRIDSGGNVSVGTTSAVSNARLAVERIGGVGNEAAIGFTSSGTAKWKIGNNASDSFVVYTPSNVGVYINSGATSWTATSDERLKNITGNIENALDAVQTLRAVKFTWIADDENKSQVGLIAQDVQAVLPEVITEDAEGYLGIRYTETIPLLVAAIQEQQTTIEALEARITALEAG